MTLSKQKFNQIVWRWANKLILFLFSLSNLYLDSLYLPTRACVYNNSSLLLVCNSINHKCWKIQDKNYISNLLNPKVKFSYVSRSVINIRSCRRQTNNFLSFFFFCYIMKDDLIHSADKISFIMKIFTSGSCLKIHKVSGLFLGHQETLTFKFSDTFLLRTWKWD